MNDLFKRAQPYQLPLLTAMAIALPLLWSFGRVPLWVSGASALTALVALVLMFARRRPARATRGLPSDAAAIADNINGMLYRWSGMANETHDNLHDVRAQIHGVMEQTEQAVLNLSGSFRNITTKTNEQLAYTLDLLQNTHGLAPGQYSAPPQSPSLPDYINSAQDMLHRLVAELKRCGRGAQAVMQYENDIQIGDKRTDILLEEMHSAFARIDQIAAALSDRAIAEQLRSLSAHGLQARESAHRHIRSLRNIRSESYKDICNIAAQAKDVSEAVQKDMNQLGANMLKKNQEVATLVGRINTLGEEVRKDIYKVIVELQFQDITHQKLERVKTPLINELGQGLRAIAQETHLLYEKLRCSVMGRGLLARTSQRGDDNKDAATPIVKAPNTNTAFTPVIDGPKPDMGNKVELF